MDDILRQDCEERRQQRRGDGKGEEMERRREETVINFLRKG